jgi:L-2-hydroxyglutarate oxidase LhgO
MSSGVTSADLVVVGAGILGLAVAREALLRYDGLRVLVLEKEDRVAAHQTGHNSGVVHSGIYYPPGSLKAQLCVQGSRALYAYCEEQGIATERCGKVVVATDERDLARLDEIHARARANGVEGVTLLGEDDLRDVEPAVRGIRALHSPGTGIVDFRQVARSLAEEIAGLGAAIRARAAVHGMRRSGDRTVRLATTAGPVEAGVVITCAGLHSDRLARMTGGPVSPRIVPFRGRYHALSAEASGLVRGLVYPVPDPSFPFLGVHFTKQISGEVWTGPNAVLALAREGYRGWDVNPRDLWETLSYSGFRTLARRYWRAGLSEVRGDVSRKTFVRALQRLVPSVRAEHLAGTRAGVRAQALSSDGRLLDDFWFDRADRVLHLRNAPSPAATSSLALAEEVVGAAEEFLADGSCPRRP